MILDIGANNNSISSFVNQVKRKRPETEIVITTSGSENEAIMLCVERPKNEIHFRNRF